MHRVVLAQMGEGWIRVRDEGSFIRIKLSSGRRRTDPTQQVTKPVHPDLVQGILNRDLIALEVMANTI